MIGWPVFGGLIEDWRWFSGESLDCKSEAMWPILLPFYVVSVPVDLAVDLVLAAVELVASLFGWSRGPDVDDYDAVQQGHAAGRPQAAGG